MKKYILRYNAYTKLLTTNREGYSANYSYLIPDKVYETDLINKGFEVRSSYYTLRGPLFDIKEKKISYKSFSFGVGEFQEYFTLELKAKLNIIL